MDTSQNTSQNPSINPPSPPDQLQAFAAWQRGMQARAAAASENQEQPDWANTKIDPKDLSYQMGPILTEEQFKEYMKTSGGGSNSTPENMIALTPTMKKVLIALAVIIAVWVIVKSMSKKRRSRKVIVTRMPAAPLMMESFEEDDEGYEEEEGYDEEEEGFDEEDMEGMEAEDDDDEGYAEWDSEGMDEYSGPQFSSDLLSS